MLIADPAPFSAAALVPVPVPAALASVQGAAPRRAEGGPNSRALLDHLARARLIDHADMLTVLADHARSRVRVAEILLARRLVDEHELYRAMASVWSMALIDPVAEAPDPRLVDLLGAETCLVEGVLPWRNLGAVTVFLCAHPESIARLRGRLVALFGPVCFALAPRARIESCVNAQRGPALARQAETRLALSDSCRDWDRGGARVLGAGLAALAALSLLFPYQTYVGALIIVLAGMVPVIGLKLTALLIGLLSQGAPAPAPAPAIARRPVVSVIVALYKEADIAGRLVRRLGRLDYPHDLLDVILAVEEDDAVTLATLRRTRLPPWMRVAVVPRGRIKTKPRALNFALNLCRGDIIGVYDAEDAPEADQISKVVQRFHERGSEVACLQGILDYYNPQQNWLARCFTLEYGAWFRVVLPGLARLGLPVPLGGTTLFFRREALLALGGWDAHNVTEDADLGMRLARRGYRTELIGTVTYEEANCRTLPWIRQRSRWIKGYMMTYAIHMRDPIRLWHELGPKGFAGFQILILGSLVQVLLAPLMWSAALIGLFAPDQAPPLMAALLAAMMPLTIASEFVSMAVLGLGRWRSRQPIGWLWLPTLILYFPLAALASYKALWEAVVQPFYWDKTRHGHLHSAKGISAATPGKPAEAPSAP